MTGRLRWKIAGDEAAITFADGKLYIRHADRLFIINIRVK